jgi:hypothetical protein
MKTSTTYMNEFTGEVFTDKRKCEQAEAESKKKFIDGLIEEVELVKDICNSHDYCKDCPLADDNDDCATNAFTDKYLDIIHNLQRINNYN